MEKIKDIACKPDFDKAVHWILESGIQHPNGGFYAWYDCERKQYSFLYPEVTGYALQLLAQLYKETKKEIFLQKGTLAADWLLNIKLRDGSFYCKYFSPHGIDRSRYVFDAAICSSGLLKLFDITSDPRYLKASLDAANWVLKSQNPDGSFVACYSPSNEMIENDHWSQARGCHHLKNLLLFLEIYKRFEDKEFFDSASRLLKWGSQLQLGTGRFVVAPGSEKTYSHAHCYATEGLSKAMRIFEEPTIEKRLIDAARWLSNIQNEDGSIWNWTFGNDRIKVCDAAAQALRIWRGLFLERAEFFENIEKGLGFLKKMQCLNGDVHSCGGFFYGEQNGKRIRHVNTWATLFSVQFLMFLQSKEKNGFFTDALF